MASELKLYIRHSATEPHEMYAYGEPWIAMALYMDDIKFKTPEEAKAWWEVNYGDQPNGEDGEEDEVFYGNETETF